MKKGLIGLMVLMGLMVMARGQVGSVRREGTNVWVSFSNCPPCAVVQASLDSGTNWVDLHMSKRVHPAHWTILQTFNFWVPADFHPVEFWRVRSCGPQD